MTDFIVSFEEFMRSIDEIVLGIYSIFRLYKLCNYLLFYTLMNL